MTGTVFVSGASGFIAQHIIKQLLNQNYKVIGSVRSKEKGESILNSLKSHNLPTNSFKYDIIEDIGAKGAFDKTLKTHKDINKFLHVASPFSFSVKDVKTDLVDPAVQGTLNALNAIKQYGTNVDRVVMTSAIVAMTPLKPSKDDKKLNESTWNAITYEQALKSKPMFAYIGSKVLAEKSAWEFVKNESPNFKFTTVNPSMIFGPQAFGVGKRETLNQSCETINKILKLTAGSKIPPGEGTFVDVRDVAKAHILAMENEDTIDKRLLLIAGDYNNQGILNIIREEFEDLDVMLPEGDPSKGVVERTNDKFDDSKTRELLNIDYINLRKSVHDTVLQLLAE